MNDKPTLQRWHFTDYGLEHLERAEAPLPSPGRGQILVKVEAASLNYRDLLIARNTYRWAAPLPFVPASDMAGTVLAVGEGVQRWRGGERVISTFVAGWLDGDAPASSHTLGVPGPGVLASHVLLDADWATAAPASLDAVQASTLPCAALTAWFALVEQGGLHAGQSVLIHGTGGVALFGLQFARLHGAQVLMVSGSEDKRAQAQALGAHHVLARDADWPAEVMRLTGGRGADQVLETVGGPNIGRSLQALVRGGRVSVIGVLEGGQMPDFTFDAIGRRATIQGISVGHRAALERMVRAVDVNRLVPVVAAEYGFDQAPKAFEHLARGAFGKVVVRV